MTVLLSILGSYLSGQYQVRFSQSVSVSQCQL